MQPQCSQKKALAMLATDAGRAGGRSRDFRVRSRLGCEVTLDKSLILSASDSPAAEQREPH